jgi:hypothetical protein
LDIEIENTKYRRFSKFAHVTTFKLWVAPST